MKNHKKVSKTEDMTRRPKVHTIRVPTRKEKKDLAEKQSVKR